MSIQSIVATILERELAARGVHSLRHSDCMEIVENLLVRLKELDQELAARNREQSLDTPCMNARLGAAGR